MSLTWHAYVEKVITAVVHFKTQSITETPGVPTSLAVLTLIQATASKTRIYAWTCTEINCDATDLKKNHIN